ncbi:transmembrane protein 102 [Antechinus flavipes]|uniref:transmembrane protein 102 n=1 Tax=Antechinus flavipes TaxID=38775 RepID=UPI00223579DB|nr:transmembrane protein 102 [Antechinus flavipes]XP_051851786.1 transmembrane protein 102 [Antechinus flavipes]
MASAVWGSTPWWGPPPPAPARPVTDLDFCSGAQLQELTQLIQELEVQESWHSGPKPGADLLRAKDFVFSLLGLIHRRDPRVPERTELLLLRGGVREGSLDLGPGSLGPYVRGPHYDAGFTLLIPLLWLDCKGVRPYLELESGSAWLRLQAPVGGASVLEAWHDCLKPFAPEGLGGKGTVKEACPLEKLPCDVTMSETAAAAFPPLLEDFDPKSPAEERRGDLRDSEKIDLLKDPHSDVTEQLPGQPVQEPEGRGAQENWPALCPTQVASWFFSLLSAVAVSLNPDPGSLRLVHASRHAGVTTILLSTPGPPSRLLLFDLVPGVSVAGWPGKTRTYTWMGSVAAGPTAYYLVPGYRAKKDGLHWRICFARQELALKARIPQPLLQAHAAAQALLRPLVAGAGCAAPYLLRTLLYWACERLPALYLGRPENTGACCLGLLDELSRGLEAGALPHYFLEGEELAVGERATELAGALARLRGDPVGALRTAVEEAKTARKGGGVVGGGSLK